MTLRFQPVQPGKLTHTEKHKNENPLSLGNILFAFLLFSLVSVFFLRVNKGQGFSGLRDSVRQSRPGRSAVNKVVMMTLDLWQAKGKFGKYQGLTSRLGSPA